MEGARARLRLQAQQLADEEPSIANLDPMSDDEARRRDESEGSLYHFVREFFETIDSHPFVDGWHIKSLCLILQYAHKGIIRRLLVNMPQRHMKSIIISVLFPCWIWVQNPSEKFILGYHSLDLGKDLAEKRRDCLVSEKFLRWFGHKVQLRVGSNNLMRFRTTAGGLCRVTSVGASITGEGSGYVIIDDPHDTDAAESDVIRSHAVKWATKTMMTRLDQMKLGRRIVTCQRVHPFDVSAALLQTGMWVHMNLPAEYVPTEKCRIYLDVPHGSDVKGGKRGEPALVFEDPRTIPGEALWPEHIDKPELNALKRELGPRAYSAFFQQNPLPPEGAMFKRSDWIKVSPDDVPRDVKMARYWDLASTKVEPGKLPDWTCGALVGKSKTTYIRYLINMVRTQESARTVMDLIVRTAKRDGRKVPVIVELEPGSNSDFMLAWMVERLDGYLVIGKRSSRSKERRAEPIANQAGNGLWRIVDDAGLKESRKWNEDTLQVLEVFPNGPHDDDVDAISGAGAYLDGKDRGSGLVISRAHQVISCGETIKYIGLKSASRLDPGAWVPLERWNVAVAVAYDERAGREGAAIYAAMPPEKHRLHGVPFIFKHVTLEAGMGAGAIIDKLEMAEREFGKLIVRRLVSPESVKLQEAFKLRYRNKYGTWSKDLRAGLGPLRDALVVNKEKPHPIFDVEDAPMQGKPNILFVVADAQVNRAWDERGLKSLLRGIEQYTADDEKGATAAAEFPPVRALLGLASVWFAPSSPKTRQELIDELIPDGLAEADISGANPGYDRQIAINMFRHEAEREVDRDATDFEFIRR